MLNTITNNFNHFYSKISHPQVLKAGATCAFAISASVTLIYLFTKVFDKIEAKSEGSVLQGLKDDWASIKGIGKVAAVALVSLVGITMLNETRYLDLAKVKV